jgi:predicted RNase H-like HicB family nuclease
VGYTVIFHKAEEGGYWGEVPALPGCFSQGETIEETMDNIKEAIELHLKDLKEENAIPEDKDFVIGRVEIPAI